MLYRWLVVILLGVGMTLPPSAGAQVQRLIVRDRLGLGHLSILCPLLGCTVVNGLGDPQQNVFLVNAGGLNLVALLQLLQVQLGIANVEVDQVVSLVTPSLTLI